MARRPGSDDELPWSATQLSDSGRATLVPPTIRDQRSQRALEALARLRGEAALGGALEIGRTLGEGGMGVVRLATQLSLGRPVAVKTLRPERRSDENVLDLLQEAWVTGSLEHPNVVPVYSLAIEADGAPVVVFRRIEGEKWGDLMHDPAALRDRLGDGDPLDHNLGIFLRVLDALRFAHSKGILHRDLKPDNVMIGEFGEVYLLDWGIAVSLSDDGSGRLPLASEATEVAGTPCYMAPEMLAGGPLAATTDIYLAGAVLYELLTGNPPHEGDSPQAIAASIRASSPRFPGEAPLELVRICKRAMDPDPAGRFERIEQLRLALQGFLRHRGATRLAEQAARRLDELRALLDGPGRGPDARLQIYRLFGECRFGFREALAGWRDHDLAAEGLRGAVAAMVDYELAAGAPDAAAALLADLAEPHPDLEVRVEAALRAREDDRRRVADLERLGRDLDRSVGQRTRVFLVLVLGMMWTVFPLIGGLTDKGEAFARYDRMMSWSGALFAVVLGFGVWARDSIMKTAYNRRLIGAALLVLAAQALLALAARWLGVAPRQVQVIYLFLWTTVSFMLAFTVEPRLAPTAIAQLACFLCAARWPHLRFFFMSAGNFALTVNAVIIWRPARGTSLAKP